MKFLHYLTIPALFFVAIGAGSASATNLKLVVVTNNTQYTMTQLFASPSSSSADWDTTQNLYLGSLLPGQVASINVDDGQGDCTYDLMAVLYGAAQPAYQYSVNACNNGLTGASWTINN